MSSLSARLPTRLPRCAIRRRVSLRIAPAAMSSLHVLNAAPAFSRPSGPPPDGLALSARLQSAVLGLQADFLREDGSGVDYEACRL